MSVQVVDASALAALLFGEPEAARVANLLEGAERIAPSLVRYEMAGVCLKKQHAYPDLRDSLLSVLDLYPQLGFV
jgi:predicted nucleic acid-binding protein